MPNAKIRGHTPRILGRDNLGCRLTEDEILFDIDRLRRSSAVFGGAKFTFPTLTAIYDDLAVRGEPFAQFELTKENHWSGNGFLNIYYAGHVLHPVVGAVKGMAVDPRDAQAFVKPFVLVNDGGGLLPSGFVDIYQPWFLELFPDRTLEHEVGHFLLDRINCPPYDQPPLPSGANAEEHVACPLDHLMQTGGCGGIRPILLPTSEQNEIRCRVQSDTWYTPQTVCRSPECP